MRNTSKTLVGGVLAALLVMSASPAQAFGPQDPVVGTEQEIPATDPPVIVEDENTEEGNQTPADVPQDAPESDETGAVEEVPAEEVPAEEIPAEEVPVDDVAAAQADASKTVTEVPNTIALSGRLVLLPNEPDPTAAEGEVAAETGLFSGVLLATDSGAFVPVDTSAISEPISGDSEFTGSAVLPESARAAVAAQLEAEGALSEVQLLDTVNQAVIEEDEGLQATGTVTTPAEALSDSPLGAAPVKKKHTADVVYFGGSSSSRNFNETQIRSLVSQTSTYWKSQSNGAVDGLTVNRYKALPRTSSACVPATLWSAAAQYFKANSNTYTNGHHLIVVADSRYRCGGGAGLAGIGTNIHSGGEIWVDLAGWSGSSDPATQGTVNKSLSTLAHEVGHNLSLGHSQSRACSGRTIDAPTTWKDDDQNRGLLKVLKPSGSTCRDVEYGNTWDLMGHTNSAGSKPVALGLAQRTALGVNPSGSMRTVQASGGRVQNFTLDPLGNNAGLRGLKVSNPRGESFYVEYRNNVGQDSSGPNANPVPSADGSTAVTNGVVVSKSYPTAKIDRNRNGNWASYPAKRSTALTYYKTSGSYANMKHLAMAKDGVSTPISSVARVRVTNIAGGKAHVRVEFAPFTDVTYDQKFAKEINWMSSSKLSTGINAGNGLRKYQPKTNVTREAMAAFLFRINAPKNYKAPAKSYFSDMKPSDKFYKEISWMYSSKLSTGVKQKVGKPKYMPKAGVTREAMAAFIYRMDTAKKPVVPKKSPFVDMTPRTKFYKEIAWMSQKGLSTGVNKNGKRYYMPKDSVTREAMAAFIYRLKH